MIPHPVYPSTAVRADDGQTILALGVIRPYKGLADAVEVVSRLPDARLLVAGDPAMPLDGLRDAPRTEWRLGYLTPGGARPGSLGGDGRDLPLQGRARPVGRAAPGSRRRRSRRDLRRRRPGGAGRELRRRDGSFPPATSEALTEAVRELLADPAALAAARAGADRARAELTWDAAATRHLDLYRELA